MILSMRQAPVIGERLSAYRLLSTPGLSVFESDSTIPNYLSTVLFLELLIINIFDDPENIVEQQQYAPNR